MRKDRERAAMVLAALTVLLVTAATVLPEAVVGPVQAAVLERPERVNVGSGLPDLKLPTLPPPPKPPKPPEPPVLKQKTKTPTPMPPIVLPTAAPTATAVPPTAVAPTAVPPTAVPTAVSPVTILPTAVPTAVAGVQVLPVTGSESASIPWMSLMPIVALLLLALPSLQALRKH